MVVTFHAGLPVPGGFAGVDVFFVISGFVITSMLYREWSANGRVSFKRFYLRRFRRLTPALSVMVATTVLASALVLSPLGAQQTTAQTAVGAMFMVANFVIASTSGGYFGAAAEANPLLNTWSLSVEEQFYLLFPALLVFGWLMARRHALPALTPFFVVCSIAVFSFGLVLAGNAGISFPGSEWVLGFYSPFTRAWEFAVGSLLALWTIRGSSASQGLLTASGLVGLGLLGFSLWAIDGTTEYPGPMTLLPVVGTALVIFGGADARSGVARALSIRPLVNLGDYSYSIYLWHWPFIVVAVTLWPQSGMTPALVATVVSTMPAVVSYRWLEQPLRNKSNLGRVEALRQVVVVMLPTVVLAGVVGAVADRYWMPKYASGGMVVYQGDIGHDEFHEYVQSNYFPCTPQSLRAQALYWKTFLRCQQSQPSGPVSVALVGDSHAEHLFLGLADEFPDVNIAYYILGDLPIRSSSREMAQIIDVVSNDPAIRTVLIAAFWKQRGLPVESLASTIKSIRQSGKTVLVTDDIPDFPFDPVQCRNRKSPMLAVNECTQDAVAFRASLAPYKDSLEQIAANVPGVRVLSTSDFFCSTLNCSMTRGQNLLYRDSHHLNINGSRYVAQRLKAEPHFSDVIIPH